MAHDLVSGDLFGSSVAISGGTAIVGARGEHQSAEPGTAYIFVLQGGSWLQRGTLAPADRHGSDGFGSSVAIQGDTAIVGAPSGNGETPGSGAAYVFTRTGTTWTQQTKLVGSGGDGPTGFGNSVAISGDTVIVGADGDDTQGDASGAAYVFTRSGATWSQQAKLLANDGAASDQFGNSVAISGDTALIGAEGVDGTTGTAYVFTRDGATWTQDAELIPPGLAPQDDFGTSVAMSGDTAIIGALADDDQGADAGSAHVFVRTGTTWTHQAELHARDGAAEDFFGRSVAISGDDVVVGAPHGDGQSGSGYVFTRSGTTWTQTAKLLDSEARLGDNLGHRVAVSGGTAIMGAWGADVPGARDAGTAYTWNIGFPRGLLGEYFHDDNLTEPAFERVDLTPTFDVDADTPDPRLDPNTFSVRWTGYVTAPATGSYTFYIKSDDASRLYLDDTLLIDNWDPEFCCPEVASSPVTLEDGRRTAIRMEYKERFGHADNRLAWSGPGFAKQTVSAASLSVAGLLATYHDDTNLTSAAFTQVEPVDHDWGTGSPDPRIGNDNFSVRWTGFVTAPETGAYTFYTRSDDGARVRIANHTVLDDWQEHAASEDVASSRVNLVGGVPTWIEVEHYEHAGFASMQLKWQGPNTSKQVVPQGALLPALPMDGPHVRAVSGGSWFNCALFDTGNVDCWGWDMMGGAGQYLGGDAVQIATGNSRTCVLLATGNVECWQSSGTPRTEYTGGDAVQVVTGGHTCALLQSGNIDCWGSGQAPDREAGDAVQVTAGWSHECALLETGDIDCWGGNGALQAEDYAGGDAIQVAAGGFHTCALLQGGNVHCWGDNSKGQSTPYVGGDAVKVVTGLLHTCVLLVSGDADCRGWNTSGQSADYMGGDAVDISAGRSSTCVALAVGEVTCWGDDSEDQLDPRFDGTPPTLDPASTVTIEATGPTGGVPAYPVPQSDAPVACSPRNTTTFALGTSQATCTATDDWGNIAEQRFAVVVVDTTPPVIAPHADEEHEATAFGGAHVTYAAPVWTDIVDGNGPADCIPASGVFLPMGNTTINCTTIDRAGNEANATQFVVTVVPGPVVDVVVSPDGRTVNLAQPVTFSAQGFDRFGNPADDRPLWTAEGGSIDQDGNYAASTVGSWAVNATVQDVVGTIVVHATDQLRLDVQMDEAQFDAVGALTAGVGGRINVTFWDRTPLANATVDIVVTRVAAGLDLDSATISVTSGPDGTARFRMPDGYALVGGYRVEAAVAWNGNAGTATTQYAVF